MRDATRQEIQDIMEGKNWKYDGLIYNPERKAFNPVIEEEGKVNIIGSIVVDITTLTTGTE